MATLIETALEKVFQSGLVSVAQKRGLQCETQLSGAELSPQRLIVSAKDLGEEKAIRIDGIYGRKMEVAIHLSGNFGDRAAGWYEETAAAVAEALQNPQCSPESLAAFVILVIQEIAESDLSFDKANWEKRFAIALTAKLA